MFSAKTIFRQEKASPQQMAVFAVLVVLGGIALYFAHANLTTYHIDWYNVWKPATYNLLHGISPYKTYGFYSPGWLLLVFIPIYPLAYAPTLLLFAALISYVVMARYMGANRLSLVLFMTSPMILLTLALGNIEWLVFLGLLMPPSWGLFFVTLKPQVGIGVALFWLIEAARQEPVRAIKTAIPITVVLFLSIMLWGFWPRVMQTPLDDEGLNTAVLFPYSIIIGVILMIVALRTHDVRYALAASPFFSPYVIFHAWSGVMLASVKWPIVTLILYLTSWAIILYPSLS